MKFVNFARGAALGALALGLSVGNATAQNGTNWDILSNGFDVVIAGIGAGTFSDPDGSPGTGDEIVATAADGLGYWVPGEDLSAATVAPFFGTFGYRIVGWREFQCLLTPGANTTGAGLVINYPHISFYEHNSPNSNCPTCFDNPFCTTAAPGALLPSAGDPFPSSCFTLSGVPTAFGPSSLAVLLPSTALGLSANPIYILAAANNTYLDIPDPSIGFCWTVEFGWAPSALPLQDNIEGLWTYRQNSPDGNQYWGISNDETNVWASNTWTLLTDLGLGGQVVLTHPANQDYVAHLQARDAVTRAALAPTGFNGVGNTFYAGPIPNGAGAPLGPFDPNGGFDIGRGAHAIALSGTGGAAGPLGAGNQALTNNPPTSAGLGANVTTLGFSTFDNFGNAAAAPVGRAMFASIDLDGLNCVPSGTLVPDITKGIVRVPFNAGGFVTFGPAIQFLFQGLFGHSTASGYFDPDFGPTPPGFSVPLAGGHSIHLATSAQVGACAGVPLNLTYGSVGLKTNGKLDFQNANGSTSGRKELFLMF